jgi:chitinase
VRWGVNGLAFNTIPQFGSGTSAVYLVQTTLVSNAEPIPTGVQFEVDNNSAFEGSTSNQLVKVTRSGDISGSISVDYATADGTAKAGSDYTAVSGTLNFAPNELSKFVNVPILNDNLFENGNETFTLNLSAPTGGAVLASPSTTLITIFDNDSKPFISTTSTRQFPEGNAGITNFVFTVSLSNPSVQTLTVDYVTSNGTASSSSDYVPNSGTLTFAPGTTSATITVQVSGDTTVEPDC